MTDPKPQGEQHETPEDVATLYSWANLHGAKYRDFSASRALAREEARVRAEEARLAEVRRLQEIEERKAQEEAQLAARIAAEAAEAARQAEAERLAEIARQAEAERQAVLAAQEAQRLAIQQRGWQPHAENAQVGEGSVLADAGNAAVPQVTHTHPAEASASLAGPATDMRMGGVPEWEMESRTQSGHGSYRDSYQDSYRDSYRDPYIAQFESPSVPEPSDTGITAQMLRSGMAAPPASRQPDPFALPVVAPSQIPASQIPASQIPPSPLRTSQVPAAFPMQHQFQDGGQQPSAQPVPAPPPTPTRPPASQPAPSSGQSGSQSYAGSASPFGYPQAQRESPSEGYADPYMGSAWQPSEMREVRESITRPAWLAPEMPAGQLPTPATPPMPRQAAPPPVAQAPETRPEEAYYAANPAPPPQYRQERPEVVQGAVYGRVSQPVPRPVPQLAVQPVPQVPPQAAHPIAAQAPRTANPFREPVAEQGYGQLPQAAAPVQPVRHQPIPSPIPPPVPAPVPAPVQPLPQAQASARNSAEDVQPGLQSGYGDQTTNRWYALKHLFDPNATPAPVPMPPPARVPALVVFSLAGGVGKTSLVASLGRALSSRGEKVLLVDTAAYGLLPFFFGARDQRPGMLRTFNPPGVSIEAPIQLVTFDPDGPTPDHGNSEQVQVRREDKEQDWLLQEIGRFTRGVNRVLIDLPTASGATTRRILKMAPTVLVPILPDMNSVVSVGAIEAFFRHNGSAAATGGKPGDTDTMPYYVLNQFDYSLPLHMDVREILREQIGDRLLSFTLRRSPAISEALAEGMTVIDYAPSAVVAEDYAQLADWVRSLSAPAIQSYRGVRWSER